MGGVDRVVSFVVGKTTKQHKSGNDIVRNGDVVYLEQDNLYVRMLNLAIYSRVGDVVIMYFFVVFQVFSQWRKDALLSSVANRLAAD